MKNAADWEAIDEMIADARSLAGKLNTLLKGIKKEVGELKSRLEKSATISAKVGKRPRITFDEICRIKSLYNQGQSRRILAEELGCDVRQIGNYLAVADYEEPLRSAIFHDDIAISYAPKLLLDWGEYRIRSEFSSLLEFAQLHSNSALKGKNGLITKGLVKAYEDERNKSTSRRR
jgi:hypothetical protein